MSGRWTAGPSHGGPSMARYRIAYRDINGQGRYQDVEATSLAHAVWDLAKDAGGDLVDTMVLPSIDNSHKDPVHVNLYPDWTPTETYRDKT